jgi:hypothetical protein
MTSLRNRRRGLLRIVPRQPGVPMVSRDLAQLIRQTERLVAFYDSEARRLVGSQGAHAATAALGIRELLEDMRAALQADTLAA